MAKNNEAKIIITADTKDLRAETQNANKSISEMKTELKVANAEFKNGGDKIAFYSKKQEILAQMLSEQQTVVDNYTALLEQAEKAQDTKAIEKYTRELNAQKAKLIDNQREFERTTELLQYNQSAIGKLSNKISSQEKELGRLKQAYANATLEYGENSQEVKKLAKNINSISNELNSNKKQLQTAKSGAEEFGKSLDDLNNSSNDVANNGFTVLKGTLSSLVSDGIKTAAKSVKDFVIESDKATSVFQAQTGATAEEMEAYKDAMTEIYGNNFGDDMLDIANSMAAIKQQLGSLDLDSDELRSFTQDSLLLRDTYGYDVQESMRAVNMLMNQFGINGNTALNLIIQGTQKGLNKNGDLLDSINEYSVHYKQMGYSAEGFFNSLLNGTAAGTFSVDKLGDAMKEFGIRTKDTASSTTEGFELLGLDANKMRGMFAKGGESAQTATNTVLKALFSLDDEVKQNQAGVDLFGTMWEDLGKDGVEALMNTQGGITDNIDALSELNDVRYDNLSDFFAGVKRNFESEIMPVINETFPAIKESIQAPLEDVCDFIGNVIIPSLINVLTWMSEHKKLIIIIVTVIGTVIGVLTALNALEALGSALNTAQTTSLWGLIAAKWAENSVNIALASTGMAAIIPIILIVSAIAAVIAIIVVCIKHQDAIKNKVKQVTASIHNRVTGLKDKTVAKIQALRDKIAKISHSIRVVVIGVVNAVIGGVEHGVNKVIKGVNRIISGINKIVGAAGSVIGLDVSIPLLAEVSLPRVALASGGVAFKPINALIGEGGEPEAVAPVSVLKSYIQDAVNISNRTMFIIDYTLLARALANLHTVIELDNREVGRVVRGVK